MQEATFHYPDVVSASRKRTRRPHVALPRETLPGFPGIALSHWQSLSSDSSEIVPTAASSLTGEAQEEETEIESQTPTPFGRDHELPDIQVAEATVILPPDVKGTKGWLPTMKVLDLPRGHQPFKLELKRPRWQSTDLSRNDELLAGLLPPRRISTQRQRRSRTEHFTHRLRVKCVDAWVQGEPLDLIARRTRVPLAKLNSWIWNDLPDRTTAWRTPDRLDTLQYVGIDEIFWRQQPVAVFVDLVSGQLIDLLPSRDQDVIEEALRQLIEVKRLRGQPQWRPVIATDLWTPYRQAIQGVFGDRAIHVADRFHLILKVQKGLREAAWQLTSREAFGSAEASHARRKRIQQRAVDLYQYRRSVRGQAETREETEARELKILKAEGLTSGAISALREAITLATEFSGLWNCVLPGDAWTHLRSWRSTVIAWGQQRKLKLPFNALLHLLDTEQWAVEVINGLLPEARLPGDRLTTTAQVERVNGRLKRLSRWMQNRVNAASVDVARMKEQRQFHRFRARALCHINLPAPEPLTLHSTLLPEPAECPCGTDVDVIGTDEAEVLFLVDIPLWGAKVIAQCPAILTRCPHCLTEARISPQSMSGLTPRMHEYMKERVSRDGTIRSIARETGLSESRVKAFLEEVPPPAPPKAVPPFLGFVPFRWRRQHRMLITDMITGRPVDLLDTASEAAIATWLSSYPSEVQWLLLDSSDWIEGYSPSQDKPTIEGTPVALDRFTAQRLQQQVLYRAVSRYRHQQSTARRRTQTFRRIRRDTLSNPLAWPKPVQQRLDASQIRRNLSRHLGDPAVAAAYALVQLARFLFQQQRNNTLALPEDELHIATWLWFRHYEGIRDLHRPPVSKTRDITPQEWQDRVNSWRDSTEFTEAFRQARALASPENEPQVAALLDQISDIILETYGSSTKQGKAAQAGEILARNEFSLARSRAALPTIRRLRAYGGRDWDRLRLIVQNLGTARHI